LEGNFANFEQTGSSHTNEYHAVQELLKPKFEKLFKECGSKIDKFMGTLGSDKLIRRELSSVFMNRGVITVMANTGEIQTFAKNDLHKDFSWGWVSNAYDYKEEQKQQTKPEPEKGSDEAYKTARIKAARLEAEAKEKKEADKPAEDPKMAKIRAAKEAAMKAAQEAEKLEKEMEEETTPVEAKTETRIPDKAEEFETVMAAPPASDNSNNKVKKWYRKNYGQVPSNWVDRPKVPIKVKKVIKSLQELKDVVPKNIPSAEAKPKPEQDDEALHAKQEQEAEVTDEILPVVSPKEKAHVLDVFMKRQSIDASSKEIIDPASIPEIESRYPTFAELYGLPGLEVAYRWSYEDLYALTEDRKSAALLLMNLCSKCVELEKKIPPKKAETSVPPTKKLDLQRRRM
jgi:hypothetical protein